VTKNTHQGIGFRKGRLHRPASADASAASGSCDERAYDGQRKPWLPQTTSALLRPRRLAVLANSTVSQIPMPLGHGTRLRRSMGVTTVATLLTECKSVGSCLRLLRMRYRREHGLPARPPVRQFALTQ